MDDYKTYHEYAELVRIADDFGEKHSCPKCKKPIKCSILDDLSEYNKLKNIAIEFECSCHWKGGSTSKLAWAKELGTLTLNQKEEVIRKIYWLGGILTAMNLMPWDPDHMEKKYLERK